MPSNLAEELRDERDVARSNSGYLHVLDSPLIFMTITHNPEKTEWLLNSRDHNM